MKAHKKIGLALGGGGARGFAHIGVLKVLAREGIPVSCVSGTSMGGLVGALFAAGIPIDVIEQEVIRLGQLKQMVKLVDVGMFQGAMLKGERVYQLMTKVLGEGKTFADLIVPFAVVTVDLHSGREVVLDRGLVVEAVRATISVPGVFLPVTKDPYRLVDGGILNNVPVDVVRNLGAKHVIAVDVMPNFSQNDPENPVVVPPLMPSGTPRFVEETWQAQMVMMSALTEYRLWTSKPDVLIRPILPRTISLLFGFNRASEAIAAGELAASEALPAIRAWL